MVAKLLLLPSPILIAQTAHLQLAIVFNLLKSLSLPVVVVMMFLTSALSVVMAVLLMAVVAMTQLSLALAMIF
ncbi:hypothetical protein MICAER10613_038820 [Microcystis aeruginosa]